MTNDQKIIKIKNKVVWQKKIKVRIQTLFIILFITAQWVLTLLNQNHHTFFVISAFSASVMLSHYVTAEVSRAALRLIVDMANTRWLESVDICPSGFPFSPCQNLKSCSLHVSTNVNKCQRNAKDLDVKTSSTDTSVCVTVTAEHLHGWLQSTSTC